ncbi:IS66 family insertion sequence element accessory protein TnpB [Vibrio splendidus]
MSQHRSQQEWLRLVQKYYKRNGFCLWQKRLEKDKFAWPRKMPGKTLSLTEEQWHWLLDGLDIEKMKPHQTLNYQSLN